jgi:hypothetical protein
MAFPSFSSDSMGIVSEDPENPFSGNEQKYPD